MLLVLLTYPKSPTSRLHPNYNYYRQDSPIMRYHYIIVFSLYIITKGHVNECHIHWLRIHFRKVLTSLLWEMKKAIKTLIVFFSFSIKTFFN